ncbi:MAG TPA: glycoside hydrolase family 15 protein [Roseiarcus sp.]|nr:glycoside hydrolase family 15 protein [Roseiarcus sp.]
MVEAPGWPGIPARWTSSAKDGVGAALSEGSRVWFTISHGIVNEIYYPRVDQACVRDLGLIVTDGDAFFAEVKRDCDTVVERIEDGVPAFRLTSTHRGGRFRLINQVIADPRSDSIVLHVRLETSSKTGLRVFSLLAPHLVNGGAHNNGQLSEYKGHGILCAVGDGTHLAMLGSLPFLASSVGFVGVSDGWQQLSRHRRLTDQYDTATDGNVALSAELAMGADGASVLTVGFGRTSAEAAYHALTSSLSPFETLLNDYSAGWRAWQAGLRTMERRAHGQNMYRVSANILRAHETPTFPGGVIASLSIPWGFSKGDDDMGGYHLVWPRDLCEIAGGLLACGAHSEVRRILRYLRATQEGDGSWRQNYWLDGASYWGGVQLDECAFPMLLLDVARREGALGPPDLQAFWPMVKGAAGFVVRTGPRTKQDRWEENAGYTPFTLAVAIAALLAAAEIAEACDVEVLPALLRDTADAWNEQIEDWIYVENTPLARKAGVPGYYIRVAPESRETECPDVHGLIQVRNHEAGSGAIAADELISTDALALVRFGLRAPDDPRVLNTIAVIDRLLRVELPQGPGWRRYNLDGYGEKADGRPFDGVGIGRAWPLLAGERAHYALAAGKRDEAEALLATIEAQTSPGGLIPEQVWDAAPIPERELAPGKPTGSAMPLVWAHAEYVKLLRSLADGRVFDMPPHTARRYLAKKRAARCRPWREDSPALTVLAGQALRLDLPDESIIRYTRDDWKTQAEVATNDTGLRLHIAELPTAGIAPGGKLVFTWRRKADEVWRGRNFEARVVAPTTG